MNKQVDTLMQKEMTRKEFLVVMGAGLASVMGFSVIIKLLTGKSLSSRHLSDQAYGSSVYGGKG
jgi:hypothetical protein